MRERGVVHPAGAALSLCPSPSSEATNERRNAPLFPCLRPALRFRSWHDIAEISAWRKADFFSWPLYAFCSCRVSSKISASCDRADPKLCKARGAEFMIKRG